ncbi:calmodulin 4 [Brachionus plicatilis]|uniref:Calmodulin 4 n=1 Tax=Brachionus plicatilis TaxID=10195 RepID=A0A3M7ST74_BRAPC|nr:calmodulin 4 [Brachionus plicatilis]
MPFILQKIYSKTSLRRWPTRRSPMLMFSIHFEINEKDIEIYRQCYKLYAKEGTVPSAEKLGFVMRSLNFKPTKTELENAQIDFAEFLNILHEHIQTENANDEILNAFRAYDVNKKGYLTIKELKAILTQTGEALSNRDVEMIIQEVNGSNRDDKINYEKLIKVLSTPLSSF